MHRWHHAEVAVAGGFLPYGLRKGELCFTRKYSEKDGYDGPRRVVVMVLSPFFQHRYLTPEQAQACLKLVGRFTEEESKKLENTFKHERRKAAIESALVKKAEKEQWIAKQQAGVTNGTQAH